MIYYRSEGEPVRQGLGYNWNKHDIVFVLKIWRFLFYFRRRRKNGCFGHNPKLNIFGFDKESV